MQNQGIINRIIIIFLFIILAADVGFSFLQHLYMPLDGDMAESILPASHLKRVFEDPFGFSVLFSNEIYPNPNRFFAHWSLAAYFRNIPFLFNHAINPLESIYFSCALAKIIIQIGLTLLMACFIKIIAGKKLKDILLAAVLITPLFHAAGYNTYMGIIDRSITYTFFYALPIPLLLLFFIPFFRSFYQPQQHKRSIFRTLLSVVLLVVLTFNGPLIPGIVLIVCSLVLLNQWFFHFKQSIDLPLHKRSMEALRKIPSNILVFFTVFILLSLYSLYIGRNNSYSLDYAIPMIERYKKLPEGIFYQFTQKLGFPLLFLLIAINSLLIRYKFQSHTGSKILNLFKWIGIFSVIYILLLPLGGFKDYRPNILRYDTIMPITIGLIFFYGASTLYLIHRIHKLRYLYITGIIAFLAIFTVADQLDTTKNQCEKESIQQIINSRENPVLIKNECKIMSWKKITHPEESKLNAELLLYWGVINEMKLYYQE